MAGAYGVRHGRMISKMHKLFVLQDKLQVTKGLDERNDFQSHVLAILYQDDNVRLWVTIGGRNSVQFPGKREHVFVFQQHSGCSNIFDPLQGSEEKLEFWRSAFQVEVNDSLFRNVRLTFSQWILKKEVFF